MDLKEESILGDQARSHWYYRAKSAVLLHDLDKRMPREILDIGAGSGFFSRRLLEKGAARATCVDIGYAADSDEIWAGKPIAFRRAITASNADLVLVMDVIEHVADDVALLRPYVEQVKPGARFIVSVPAFQFLWSSHDVFLEHHQRYTLPGLVRTLRACGLAVDWGHYYYGGVFPLAAAIRLMEHARGVDTSKPKSQLRRHSAPVNSILAAICAAERPFMRLNRFFGLSVFAGAHKP